MFRTMMVHFSGTEGGESVFLSAIALARACEAHLECVHVRPGTAQLVKLAAGYAMGVDVDSNIGEILKALKQDAEERAAKARAAFEKIAKAQNLSLAKGPQSEGLSARFVEKSGEEVDVLIDASRGHDLAFVAGGGSESGSKHGLRAGDSARLLVESGRPLVLTPPAPGRNAPGVVAIAWKPTPESSRAIAAAMPLLTKAKKVVILTASEGSYDADEDDGRTISSYLAWHGVKAETHKVLCAGRSASEAVVDAVRDARADMLVMGAYGRGRLSEIVFGGFTRRVLTQTELPVFLLH